MPETGTGKVLYTAGAWPDGRDTQNWKPYHRERIGGMINYHEL